MRCCPMMEKKIVKAYYYILPLSYCKSYRTTIHIIIRLMETEKVSRFVGKYYIDKNHFNHRQKLFNINLILNAIENNMTYFL